MDANLTKHSVLEAHRRQLQDGGNNEANLLVLANILGGIDAILNQYLSNRTIELTPSQLNDINDLFIQRQRSSTHKVAQFHQIQHTTNVEDYDKLYLELDANDTLLHGILGTRRAQTLINCLYHKCTSIVIFTSGIVWCVLASPYFTDLEYPLYLIAACSVLWIPYTLFMLFVLNRKAGKMIVRNFEFWLKLVYTITYCLATLVDLYGTSLAIFNDYNIRLMAIADALFLAVFMPLLITVISFWDAFYGIRKWKTGLTAFLALLFTLYATYLQFRSYSEETYRKGHAIRTNIGDTDIHFPLLSVRITSLKILSIFLWKHCVLAYFRTERAISVRIYPYLVWNNQDDGDVKLDEFDIIHEQRTLDSEMHIPATNPINMDDIKRQKQVPLREQQLSDDEEEMREKLEKELALAT
eukprot:368128_1